MKNTQPTPKIAGISSQAVAAKTGKTWEQWITLLDKAGAKKMTHKEIVAYLHTQHGVGDWWQQMVTVGYEQARGRRAKHQTPTGYEASVSKTLAVPLSTLYRAWADEAIRVRWLKRKSLAVRRATPNKSVRLTWAGGQSNVDVQFYARGDAKSQVTVQHNTLASADDVAKMKGFWGKALEKLKELLES
jgi:uncharacterized protein YndB with AHSA1/START domain